MRRLAGPDVEDRRERGEVWLVITGELSARTFVDTGIVSRLHDSFGDALLPVLLMNDEAGAYWAPRIGGETVLQRADLLPAVEARSERLARRFDAWLDRQAGFYPLAIRLNHRHRFHIDRMESGHPFPFLDSAREGPLPRWKWIERGMRRWHFSARRHVPRALVRRLHDECRTLVLTNVHMPRVVPLLTAARRLQIPVVGYVTSWDHTVGKGVISPHLDRYLVQNVAMLDDLQRYHGVPAERVVVSGWPQTDAYFMRRPREEYERLLASYDLDPKRPVVLFAGNNPINMPYEGRFVERLVSWWEGSDACKTFSLLLRPHPRDSEWRQRFRAGMGHTHAHVQESSFQDFESLVTVLQHVDCVLANGGTIMLDAVVNDRPTVCVAYDEGAPSGDQWAKKNLTGEHYRALVDSGACYWAEQFDDIPRLVHRSLEFPTELQRQRAAAARAVVGEVDGGAAGRVVSAIVEIAGSSFRPRTHDNQRYVK
jgi:CDP-Glycerol:Poly(glycerophosphate) glycerophosphotransferase